MPVQGKISPLLEASSHTDRGFRFLPLVLPLGGLLIRIFKLK
jgi:hypothetical protein